MPELSFYREYRCEALEAVLSGFCLCHIISYLFSKLRFARNLERHRKVRKTPQKPEYTELFTQNCFIFAHLCGIFDTKKLEKSLFCGFCVSRVHNRRTFLQDQASNLAKCEITQKCKILRKNCVYTKNSVTQSSNHVTQSCNHVKPGYNCFIWSADHVKRLYNCLCGQVTM